MMKDNNEQTTTTNLIGHEMTSISTNSRYCNNGCSSTKSANASPESQPLLSTATKEENDNANHDDLQRYQSTSEVETTKPTNEKTNEKPLIRASTWLRLLLFFVASIVAGGIVPGQNVYNQLFCEAGLFSSVCGDDDSAGDEYSKYDSSSSSLTCCDNQWLVLANIMNILSTLTGVMFLVSGLFFDAFGGRVTVVVGCLVLFCGVIILVILLVTTTTTTTTNSNELYYEVPMFVIGVFLVDCGSYFANVSFYSFLWHLPGEQNLILSLSNCCYNVASLTPLVLVYFMETFGWTLSLAFFFYGVLVLGAAGVSYVVVPSVEEYRSEAMRVLKIPIPEGKRYRTVEEVGRTIKERVNGAMKVLAVNQKLHCLTATASLFGFMSTFIYTTMSNPLGGEIFSSTTTTTTTTAENNEGTDLGILYNKINGMLGLFLGPFVGMLIDRRFKQTSDPTRGLFDLAMIVAASTAITFFFCSVPSWTIQSFVIVAVCVNQTAGVLLIVRYVVIFSPPQRMGTVQGIVICSVMILVLPVLLGISVIIGITGSYLVPTKVVSVLGTMGWLSYAVFVLNRRDEEGKGDEGAVNENEHNSHDYNHDEELASSSMMPNNTTESSSSSSWMSFPNHPVMLPEDELEMCKSYMVSTVDDAAFVLGTTKQEFMELSSSSNVLDQRKLVSMMETTATAERILQVAKRRNNASNNRGRNYPTCWKDKYDIPAHVSTAATTNHNNNDEDDNTTTTTTTSVVAFGTAMRSVPVIEASFNGRGNVGGEPTMDWVLSPIQPRENPRRIKLMQTYLAPSLHCAEAYGIILELQLLVTNHHQQQQQQHDQDESNHHVVVAAACACYPPGSLASCGNDPMPVGSDRFFYGLASANVPPYYVDPKFLDDDAVSKTMAILNNKQGEINEKRRQRGSNFWYVNFLGTHPSHRGKGYGKKLLNVVAKWADDDNAECYLECSRENVPVYDRCGYEVVWDVQSKVVGKGQQEQHDISMYGMVRHPQKK